MTLLLLAHARTVALTLALSALASLAACAAPSPSEQAAQSADPATDRPAAATDRPAANETPIAQAPSPSAPAPAQRPFDKRTGGPLPPERIDDTRGEVKVDTSCRTDADCTVKNVGNCCGHYPACVNVTSPTDPKGVQARCAKSGMAAVCGFPEISGCSCVKGSCQASGGTEEAVR
jgi:hypothetical protein